ncbi:hypothetical protein PRIPAC_81933 [Pristionchus pacificus]|uniref:maleylacetoacetate isomerase n=1 Tax=Pristionchus pacificus TaxID=54126 RepID=A0A2A6CM23_PRIPA|nr:hypothetical protein PRIPAC_81933 [Pristionchus pacificus]|eukprot:PDM79252.1 Glutathione S-transferase [Pristionchus pacificus]
MSSDRPISDDTITLVCYTIGLISLIISCCCMIFARKLQPTCTRGIFSILFLLQVLYTLHNFHFAVLFVPFLYVEVGGGYCIGALCEPHYVSYATNLVILMFLTGYLRSMFFLLVFIRHQILLEGTSRLKLGETGRNLIGFLIIAGGNVLPIKYMNVQFKATPEAVNRTMESVKKRFRHASSWINDNRNFGVFPKEDGDVGNFVAFITVPIALCTSLTGIDFQDDSVVLLPCIFLCSLSSISHSALTLSHSPCVRARIGLRSQSERNAEFVLAANPASRIPVLVHGNRLITESLAIIEYLDENFDGPKLLPTDSFARAKARAIALHIACGIQPIQNVRVTRKIEEMAGAGKHEAWASYWMSLGVWELEGMVHKSAGKYCVGDDISIADICLPSIVYRARAWGVNMDEFPTLTRIDATLQQIPAFAAAHPDRQIDAPEQ